MRNRYRLFRRGGVFHVQDKVKRRTGDLLLSGRGFRYYHPAQNGSASMKLVLPALTGAGYDHLEIQDGATASQELPRVTFGDLPKAERQ